MNAHNELVYVCRALFILSMIAMWVNLSGCQSQPCVPPEDTVVHYLDDAQELAEACGDLDARGCAHVFPDGRCTIWIGSREPEWVLEHEQCHCAGVHHPNRPTPGLK